MGESLSASRRAIKSVACPGGKPTRMRVSSAERASANVANNAITAISKRRMAFPLRSYRVFYFLLYRLLYRLGGTQPRDLLSRKAKRGKDLLIMLAERWPGAAHGDRRLGKARHHALHAHIAELFVGHADDGLPRQEMRIDENI